MTIKVETIKLKNILEDNKRIPRKKGQHRGSSSHSDLYTDENPKGTIKGLKFKTVDDAQKSVNKIKSSGKSHAHKIQRFSYGTRGSKRWVRNRRRCLSFIY